MSFPVPKQATGARLYYVSTEFQTVSVSKVRTNLKEFSQGTSVKGSPSIIHIHFLTALQGKGCVQRTCTHTHMHEHQGILPCPDITSDTSGPASSRVPYAHAHPPKKAFSCL